MELISQAWEMSLAPLAQQTTQINHSPDSADPLVNILVCCNIQGLKNLATDQKLLRSY